jgi:hypothetical protein
MEITKSIIEAIAIYIIGTGTLYLVFQTGVRYYSSKFQKEMEAKQK